MPYSGTPEEHRLKKQAQDAAYRAKNRAILNQKQREREATKKLDPVGREYINATKRAWRKNNPEKAKAQTQRSYAKNGDKIRQRNVAWAKSHPERKLALDRAWKRAHPEQMKQAFDLWTANNPGRHTQTQRTWRKAHPENVRIYNHTERARRRASLKGAPRNDLTHEQWLHIQSAQDHCCAYCGKRSKGHLTQDHITPISKGGNHTLHNVIGACSTCNKRKYTNSAPVFVQPLLI